MQAERRGVSQLWLDEERLMVERARRDPEAFSEIYSRYQPRVFAYARKRVPSVQDAEDITAETFTLAFEGLAKFEWRNVPFSAWLFRIASNQVALHFRRNRPAQCIDDFAVEDPDADPQLHAIRGGEVDQLKDALNGLRSDHRRAMDLRYYHGLKAREIAEQLGKTEGSVKLILHRATVSLRSQMLPLSA
jgi:RNA polymerase sigma-70 factor, ECF subfamily